MINKQWSTFSYLVLKSVSVLQNISRHFLNQTRCFTAAPMCGTYSSFYTMISGTFTAVLQEHRNTIMLSAKWLASVTQFWYQKGNPNFSAPIPAMIKSKHTNKCTHPFQSKNYYKIVLILLTITMIIKVL